MSMESMWERILKSEGIDCDPEGQDPVRLRGDPFGVQQAGGPERRLR